MNPALPQPVVAAMAQREYRMHHLLWHEIRRYWNRYPREFRTRSASWAGNLLDRPGTRMKRRS